MREAESHAGEDQQKREEVEARNRLDGLHFSVEKTFSENKESLGEEVIAAVSMTITDAKRALGEGGIERINKAFSDLQVAAHRLAEALYQGSGKSEGVATAVAGAAYSENDVEVDTDIEQY